MTARRVCPARAAAQAYVNSFATALKADGDGAWDRIRALNLSTALGSKTPQKKAGTLLELYDGALAALPKLWELGEKLKAEAGEGEAELSWRVKKPQRIWYKLFNKYDGSLASVSDCAAISLIFETPQAMEKIR